MANLIFEKTVRLPPSGSLREALLLNVWLRRQEIDIGRMRLMVAGFSDRFAKNNSASVEAFKDYVEAVFPFTAKLRLEVDKKLMERVKKEASRGVLQFSPISLKPAPKVTEYQMSEEDKEKLRARSTKK